MQREQKVYSLWQREYKVYSVCLWFVFRGNKRSIPSGVSASYGGTTQCSLYTLLLAVFIAHEKLHTIRVTVVYRMCPHEYVFLNLTQPPVLQEGAKFQQHCSCV